MTFGAALRESSSTSLQCQRPGHTTFRRGSPYAPMRSHISHANIDFRGRRGDQIDVVRLFNSVQVDLGAILLGRGVPISGNSLSDFFRGRENTLGAVIRTARLDGADAPPNDAHQTD
jgi:hypothetical protein